MILIVKKMYSKSKLIFMFHFFDEFAAAAAVDVWWEDLWPKNTQNSVRVRL